MTNKEFFKFIWQHTKKYKYKILLLETFNFILFYFIPFYALPYITKLIGDKYTNGLLNMNNGVKLVTLYVILYSLNQLWHATFMRILKYRTEHKISSDLRTGLFNHLMKQSIDFFNNNMAGILSSKIVNVVNGVTEFRNILFELTNNGIVLAIILVIYYRISVYLFLFFILWLVAFWVYYYFLVRLLDKKTQALVEENNKIIGFINDDFTNILSIKLFAKKRLEIYKIRKQGIQIDIKEFERIKLLNIINGILILFLFSLVFGIMGISFYMFHIKHITFGTFLFLCQNIFLMKKEVIEVTNNLNNFFSETVGIKDGISTLQKPIENLDRPNAKKLENIEGRIVFIDVNFTYRGN